MGKPRAWRRFQADILSGCWSMPIALVSAALARSRFALLSRLHTVSGLPIASCLAIHFTEAPVSSRRRWAIVSFQPAPWARRPRRPGFVRLRSTRSQPIRPTCRLERSHLVGLDSGMECAIGMVRSPIVPVRTGYFLSPCKTFVVMVAIPTAYWSAAAADSRSRCSCDDTLQVLAQASPGPAFA